MIDIFEKAPNKRQMYGAESLIMFISVAWRTVLYPGYSFSDFVFPKFDMVTFAMDSLVWLMK